VGSVVIFEKRGDLRVGDEDDVSTVSAVTAVGSSQRLEFLTLDRDTAVTAVSRFEVHSYLVHERNHVTFPSCINTTRRAEARPAE
jgi:hypothetical protein